MKINKMAAGLSLVLLSSSLLAACGDGAGGGDDVRTVVVWDRAGAEATSRQKFFKKWNKEQGRDLGIRVQFEPQATERYEEILRTAFQTKRGPDIFHAPSAQMGGFVQAGWVQPLDEVVDEKVLSEAKRYLPDSSELVWDGKPYAIPTTTFTVRLGINRTLFKQAGLNPDDPPTTFSEVEQAARKITKSSNGDASGVALKMGWVGFRQWQVDLPMLATDTDLGADGLFNMSNEKFEAERYKPIIEHFRTLMKDGTAYPGAENLDYDAMLGAFADGKIGMVLTSGSIVGGLQNLDSDVDLGVGPIPIPDNAKREQSPMNAGFPVSISSMAEDPEAAAKVFDVLVGSKLQKTLAKDGIPPLNEDAWNSPAARKNDDLQLFRPKKYDRQWPKTPGSVLQADGKDAEQTIISLILNPDNDIDSTLRDLSKRYQQGYREGVKNDEIKPKEFRG